MNPRLNAVFISLSLTFAAAILVKFFVNMEYSASFMVETRVLVDEVPKVPTGTTDDMLLHSVHGEMRVCGGLDPVAGVLDVGCMEFCGIPDSAYALDCLSS